MLPAFYLCDGAPAPLMTICVDQTEFVVNKLKDRGTHQAYGVVTNAQDFMHVLRFYTERWEQGARMTAGPAPAGPGSRPAVAEVVPPAEVDGVWVFSPLRHEGREWGTAVLSRVDGDRRRIYTARYMLAHQGQGAGEVRGRRCRRSGAGRSRRSAQLLQDAQQPDRRRAAAACRCRPSSGSRPPPMPRLASGRGRGPPRPLPPVPPRSSPAGHPPARPGRPGRLARPTTSVGGRDPARAQGAGRARRHRHGVPHAGGAGRERPGAGARLRRRVQALRADAGPGRTTSI